MLPSFILWRNVTVPFSSWADTCTFFKYFKLECYKIKSFDIFLNLIEHNIISVSITTSPVKYGPSIGKNRASCYFKIGKYDLKKLFVLDHVIDYNKDNHY